MEDTSHACTLMSTPVPKDVLMRTGLYFKLYTAHRTLKSVFRQTRDAAQLVDFASMHETLDCSPNTRETSMCL